jgi:cell division protein FtsQ
VALVTLSPLMSLTTIEVAGTNRLDAAALESALDSHRGTPLALLDDAQIRDDLAEFALIRSFSTEVIPPHTLVVRIVERQPIGAVSRGAVWQLVDAAGVVVESSADRPVGIPSLSVDAVDPDALPFRSVAAVLLALPSPLRDRVDEISATTRDDVNFTMIGAGHRVIWGSGERSEYKARVLEAAIVATDQSVAWEYDVSAPDSLVVRRL